MRRAPHVEEDEQEDMRRYKRAGLPPQDGIWTDAVVPYELDSDRFSKFFLLVLTWSVSYTQLLIEEFRSTNNLLT